MQVVFVLTSIQKCVSLAFKHFWCLGKLLLFYTSIGLKRQKCNHSTHEKWKLHYAIEEVLSGCQPGSVV